MRTLQEKYNAIQEGKFTKDQFLRDARLQLPNLVTRFNGYDDAVKILKNRGMISEAVSTEVAYAEYSDDALTDMIINLSRFDGNEDIIARVKAELARRKETVKESNLGHNEISSIHQEGGSWIVTYKKDGTKERVFKTEKEARAFEKTLNEARLTKNNLADYRYKPTNDMDKYPYEQILRGLRVELETMGIEGTPTAEEYKKALAKVLKNLEKDEIYYTNQVAGVKAKAKRTDVMVDATAKNEVDKENGLQKAQLKEAIKKVIKNILSEDVDPDLYPQDEEREERRSRYGQSEFGDGEEVYEMFAEDDEIDYDDENFSDAFIDGEDDLFESIDGKVEKAIKKIVAKFINTFGEISDETRQEFEEAIKYDYEDDPKGILKMDLDDAVQIFDASGLQLVDEEGLDEATDKEADKDMVRKLMRMYETEPSKFERLHKQAETQATTSKDIKFKHLLSLLNRAKAGALQSLANQDRFEADREGMYESVSLKDLLD